MKEEEEDPSGNLATRGCERSRRSEQSRRSERVDACSALFSAHGVCFVLFNHGCNGDGYTDLQLVLH